MESSVLRDFLSFISHCFDNALLALVVITFLFFLFLFFAGRSRIITGYTIEKLLGKYLNIVIAFELVGKSINAVKYLMELLVKALATILENLKGLITSFKRGRI